MSRSYKKNPFCSVTNAVRTRKFFKRVASRKVRRYDVTDGNHFKKLFFSWLIDEGKSRVSKNEWIRKFRHQYKTEKECIKEWYKAYRNK